MPKIVSKALDLRLEYQGKLRRRVPMLEVASEAEIDRRTLSKLEDNKVENYDGEVLAKLCNFYTKVLDRPIGVADLLEFDPNKKTLDLLAA